MNCNYWESHHTDGQVMLLYRIVHLGICMKLREKTVCSFVLFCFVFFKNGSRYLSEQLERKKENCHCFFLSQRWLLNEFLREHRSFNMNYWCQSMIFFFFFFGLLFSTLIFIPLVFFFLFFLMKCYTPVFNCK